MMAMRAPLTDLPIVFEDVSILARNVAILDSVYAHIQRRARRPS